ncbi:efflux RND transporter periplasmic adaptor subunit [Agaricicola taiwanensis]|uniref:efflux RND transporter periplasmic adaptor subunit n=1 Tax=Agaricicola taiwanensis TaxID=591372 RepID=UPI00166E594D|nr:efflux RND transporter periplasmic adaptor subunit [Agaricicola taiwanensis]
MTKPRAPRLRRWWLGGAALALLAVAAAGLGYGYYGATGTPGYRTETVVMGNVERKVSAVGTLEPRDYVDVGVQVSGQLKVLNVEIGDEVKAGDLLAETDPTVHQTSVASNRAKLAELTAQRAQVQAELDLAKAQFERTQSLAARNVSTQDALDIARSTVAIAEAKIGVIDAQVQQASAALKAAEANLNYTKIYAPMDGTVVSQSAVKGQTLNANQSAPIIVRVADLKTMTAQAKVVEADVVSLKPRMKAYFSTLGMPDRRWEGTVRQIQPTPEIVNDVVLYKVLVDVSNEDGVLLPSMSAQVSFIEGAVENVPVVPLAALRTGRNGDRFARVATSGGVETRKVEIGFTNRTHAEIKSGLDVGDKVITGMLSPAAADGDASRQGGMMRGGRGPRP